MYAWPLRPSGLAWLGAMTFLAGIVDAVGGLNAVVAIALGLAWWMLAFKLASEALTRAADGRDEDSGYEVFGSDSAAFGQILLGLLLFVIGSAVRKFMSPGLFIAWCALMAVVLPALVMLIVREDEPVRILDPRLWFELLRRIGVDYVATCAQLALLALGVVLLIRAAATVLPDGPSEALAHGLFLYLLLVAYHGLGELLHRHREALELPDAPEPSRRLEAATPEEVAAVAEADRMLAAERPKQAAAALDRLIRGRGATAPVHARYRALLATLGDEAALVEHARGYVAILLHEGREREALALYLDAKQRDPAFELGDPQPVSELLALAAKKQQSQLAVSLYEEFARRFPNDRDLVLNGLTTARLMDRLGRIDEARRLLAGLISRFPKHPLREDMQTTLLELDAAP